MRYEVRPINTGSFGALILATDDPNAAKRSAEDHCADSYYGTAIIDTVTQTADMGDRIVQLAQAFSA